MSTHTHTFIIILHLLFHPSYLLGIFSGNLNTHTYPQMRRSIDCEAQRTKTNGYKAHTCFNFPFLQNGSLSLSPAVSFSFTLHSVGRSISFFAYYWANACLCHFMLCLQLGLIHLKKYGKRERDESERERHMWKETWPLTSIDGNSQTHTYSMCISWL